MRINLGRWPFCFWGEEEQKASIPPPQLFDKEWLLVLKVDVPPMDLTHDSVDSLYRKLEHLYGQAKTAGVYFQEGVYLIGCDGSMQFVGEGKEQRLAGLKRVEAHISFDDLPCFETVQRRIRTDDSPGVHAYGEGVFVSFDARDGGIIVRRVC